MVRGLEESKGRIVVGGYLIGRYSDVWFFDRVSGNNQIYANQKPIKLLERIIENSTDENNIVFDPFMGSGSTGLACRSINRNFIGVEIDEYYFNMAKTYIDSSVMKRLF